MLALKYLELIWGLPYGLIQTLNSDFIQTGLNLV